MSDQSASGASQKKALDQIIALVKQMGVKGDAYLEDLPPTVRAMLDTYVSGYEPGDRAGALQRIWEMVGQTVTSDATSKVAKNTKVVTDAANVDGVVTAGEKKKIDAAASGAAATPDSPPWIYQKFGQAPTPEQEKRISDEWNTVFGTKYTYEQLKVLPQFGDATQTVQNVVEGGMLGFEPQVEYSVTLPGNRSYKITSDMQKTQFGQYGLDNKDVVRVVRWADNFNIKNEKGEPIWQPLAALIKARGGDINSALFAPSGLDKGSKGGAPRHAPKGGFPDTRNYMQTDPVNNIAQLANDYSQNMKKYGDPSMAFLATMDASLAARLMTSGGDDTKVTEQDMHLADEYMTSGGWDPTKLHDMGYAGGKGYELFLARLQAKTVSSTPPKRMRHDPETLKQSVVDFWRRMFRSEPSEAMVNQMTGELQAAEAAAPEDQAFDPEAKLRSLGEGKADYKQLYAKMQPGQTPADYQNQFINASADMIGGEAADNGAVLAGMRTGDYQTTIGATAGSSRAWNNSRFMGRLASAAVAVNNQT